MKKILIFCLCLMLCCLVGCKEQKQDVGSATLSRDPAKTGGSDLSFSYDEENRIATFGGYGEVVEYYYQDETLGRTGGCRVGVKIKAPGEIQDFSGATLSFNGKIYDTTQMFESDSKNIYIYPIVSKQNTKNIVEIIWNHDTAVQKYIIEIAEGTEFELPTQNVSTLTKQRDENFAKDGIFAVSF